MSINFHIFENFSFYYYRHYLLRLRCSFFSIWVFFHEHSRFTGLQRKGQANSELLLPLLYHFHSLHRHLDISRATTAESLRLYLAGGLEPGTHFRPWKFRLLLNLELYILRLNIKINWLNKTYFWSWTLTKLKMVLWGVSLQDII